jgi:hypothetical protein
MPAPGNLIQLLCPGNFCSFFTVQGLVESYADEELGELSSSLKRDKGVILTC